MAWETEIESVENYYADLIIIQYRNKPKARATIKLGADLYLADGLVFDLQNVLDIDTAQGAQLDLIGKILGCNRNIFGFNIDKKYFTFEKVDAYGFSDVNQLSEGLWKKYANSIGSAFALEDEDYRILLKFKALYNLRRGSWGDMDELYYRAFGNDIEIINQKDGNITIGVSNNTLAVQIADFLGYLAAPLGIGSSVQIEYFNLPQNFRQNLGTSYDSLAYGGGKFVALSQDGYISTSIDGMTWSVPVQDTELSSKSAWSVLAYGNGKFVAYDNSDYMSTSTDGETWTTPAENTVFTANSFGCKAIIYANNEFLALSTNGETSTSTDGTTWTTPVNVAELDSTSWEALTYGNGLYVALDYIGYISTSTDGSTWTNATKKIVGSGDSAPKWNSIAYGNSKFVALQGYGYISTSTDGTTWTTPTQSTNLSFNSDIFDWQAIAYDGIKFVSITDSGYFSTSKNNL